MATTETDRVHPARAAQAALSGHEVAVSAGDATEAQRAVDALRKATADLIEYVGSHQYGVTCAEAGLPMMTGVLDVIHDRGDVDLDTLDRLTPEAIEDLYTTVIGPAVDKAEDLLLNPF